MKEFQKVAAQGELRFIRLPDDFELPAKAQKVDTENNRVIVGHSETGHFHYMDPDCSTLYRLPDSILECLLVVEKPDALKHLRDYDTHESLAFKPGKYRVVTGREHTPEGWRRSQD